MVGQSRGKGKALNTIAARSGRDPAAIVDSIQAAEKAQAKAAAAAAKKAAVKKSEEEAAAAAAAAKRKAEQEEETSSSSSPTTIDNEVNNNITPAQIYSSLSPQEQYRYECFRRSGFASKPIEKFVANILVDEANKRFVSRRGTISGLGGRFNNNHHGKDNYYGVGAGGAMTAATVTDSSDADNTHSKRKKKQSKKQMLREESKRRRIAMDHPPPYLLPESNSGSSGSNCTQKAGSTVPLDQLVVPSSAPEIVAVISTLAKSYAQRLVSAARRVADADNEQQKCLDDESSTKEEALSSSTATTSTAISPHHLLEAHRYRSRVGLDPGFWMADRVDVDGSSRKGASSIHHRTSSSVGTSEAAALGIEDRSRSCFLAAIAAQDAYDKVTTANTNDVEKMSSGKDKEDEDKMDVDKK